jgi:hypothetical protein
LRKLKFYHYRKKKDKMRTYTLVASASALLLVCEVNGFSSVTTTPSLSSSALGMGYVPDGFTKESYAKLKAGEKKKKDDAAKKNLGRMGPKGFQSRSFQSFQEALEKGETTHLMPVFNAKEKVRAGKLKVEDIPYMQRGGNWDNTDVKGAKKVAWLKSDKSYAGGGFKKEQSVSIFGYGEGLDWTGGRSKKGPGPKDDMNAAKAAAVKMKKGYKAPSIYDGAEKKKFFGLF